MRNTPECIEKLTNKTARNKQAQFSNYRQTPNEKEKKTTKQNKQIIYQKPQRIDAHIQDYLLMDKMRSNQ